MRRSGQSSLQQPTTLQPPCAGGSARDQRRWRCHPAINTAAAVASVSAQRARLLGARRLHDGSRACACCRPACCRSAAAALYRNTPKRYI
ncbi:hypothetical protein MTO96_006697 [Rhipicephalus appendiculatus]